MKPELLVKLEAFVNYGNVPSPAIFILLMLIPVAIMVAALRSNPNREKSRKEGHNCTFLILVGLLFAINGAGYYIAHDLNEKVEVSQSTISQGAEDSNE